MEEKEIIIKPYWKTVSSTYVNSETLFVGKLPVASYFWDGARPKDDTKKYRAVGKVSTLKDVFGNFETEQECKDVCERALETFLKQLQTEGN